MSHIEAKDLILDLGIGGEQLYLLNDKNNILRVGADIRFDALQATKIFNLKNQTLLDAKDNLPFSYEAFNKIQIFYPDRSLLESVCNQVTQKGVKPLWPELKRILHNGGIVELFLEEEMLLPYSTSKYNDSGEVRYIWRPHIKAEIAAKKFGFDVNIERLNKEKLKNLGNDSSFIFNLYTNQYLISAIKRV